MLPFLTPHIPGIGGSIKESPEDFIVSEIPAYEPCGSGEHLYLTLEKRGLTTLEALRRIAGRLKIAERDIGYAGMKDAVGLTRQMISIPWPSGRESAAWEFDNLTLTPLGRHGNKLKLGHLQGNRFELTVRGVSPAAAENVPQVLEILQRRGVPNYFGPQRYGAQGGNHLVGLAMLRQDWQGAVDELIGSGEHVRDATWLEAIGMYRQGDLSGALHGMPRHLRAERDVLQRLVARPAEWRKAFGAVHPRLRNLFLSSCQSYLFDQIVAKRIEAIDRLMTGDLAWLHRNGACFAIEDPAPEQCRADAFEISPSGPLFGPRMTEPAGSVQDMELSVLAEAGLEPGSWRGVERMEGGRRPLRIPLEGVSYDVSDTVMRLDFNLPKGSYATSVLREFMKTW